MDDAQYSDEEARDILKRAVEYQDREDFQFSRQQLLDLGREMGLSQDAIVKAEQEWLASRPETPASRRPHEKHQGPRLAEEEAAYRRERMREFSIHFAAFVACSLLMIVINVLTGMSFPWFLIIVLGWMAGLLPHFMIARATDGEAYENGFLDWLERRKKRRLRREQTLTRLKEE